MSNRLVVRPFVPRDNEAMAATAAEETMRDMLMAYGDHEPSGPAWTAIWEGRIVGSGGFVEVYGPNSSRATAWAVMVPMSGPAIRAVKRAIMQKIWDAPYRRIEADVDYEFASARRWVRSLGFKLETNYKEAWTPDGRAVAEYVIIKDVT